MIWVILFLLPLLSCAFWPDKPSNESNTAIHSFNLYRSNAYPSAAKMKSLVGIFLTNNLQ